MSSGATVVGTTAETAETGETGETAETARSARPGLPRVLVTGALAVPAAVVVTTLAATLARGVGVDLEVPEGGEQIPLAGVAFVTGVLSTVGVALAAVLARWSSRPGEWFVRTTVVLTAVSFAPPLLVGAHPATAASLVGLHVVAAAVMVPALAAALAWQRRAITSG